MIIHIIVKPATIKRCQTDCKRNPLVRALNLHFGFDGECQLVFRLYEIYNLRTDNYEAKLALSGPAVAQKWETVIKIEEKYLPYLYEWKTSKRMRPFVYEFSVTERMQELIEDSQRFYKKANYPIHVGKGLTKNKTTSCQPQLNSLMPKSSKKTKNTKKSKKPMLGSLMMEGETRQSSREQAKGFSYLISAEELQKSKGSFPRFRPKSKLVKKKSAL